MQGERRNVVGNRLPHHLGGFESFSWPRNPKPLGKPASLLVTRGWVILYFLFLQLSSQRFQGLERKKKKKKKREREICRDSERVTIITKPHETFHWILLVMLGLQQTQTPTNLTPMISPYTISCKKTLHLPPTFIAH